MSNINRPVPNADQYYTLNRPEIGTVYPKDIYPQNASLPKLFQSLTLRGVEFKNRIFVSPMCQYASDNGHATDWHLVHLGGFATRGVGGICIEATAVVPEGRISPQDAGLWTDSQIAPLRRIVNFAHAHGAKIGIQLAHAGRKASTLAPWVHSDIAKTRLASTWTAKEDEGGWPHDIDGPSAIPWSKDYPIPKPPTEERLLYLEDAFVSAIERSKEIGFDFIEIHAAHGYLLHEFVSPLSNQRTDEYGGSLENRLRWPLRLVKRCREAWQKPLFVRISATDWAEGPEKDEKGKWLQWGVEQSKVFAGKLQEIGIDLLDCSTGGNWAKQKIPLSPGYQVPYAEAIKHAHPSLVVGTVGLITSPRQAESYLQEGKADAVFLAREFIRNPSFALQAADELGVAIKAANQHERGWAKMMTPATRKA